MKMRIASAAVLPLAVLMAACDGEGTLPDVVPAGSLSVSYEGGVAGTFAAEGAPTLTPTGAAPGLWAVAGGLADESGDRLVVTAYSGAAADDGVLVALSLPRLSGPGTVPIDFNCQTAGCAVHGMMWGVDPRRSPRETDRSCFITTGSATMQEITDARVRGTFAGRGFCIEGPGNASSLITFSEGRFDAAIAPSFRPPVSF